MLPLLWLTVGAILGGIGVPVLYFLLHWRLQPIEFRDGQWIMMVLFWGPAGAVLGAVTALGLQMKSGGDPFWWRVIWLLIPCALGLYTLRITWTGIEGRPAVVGFMLHGGILAAWCIALALTALLARG